MTTAGNPHTHGRPGASFGNALVPKDYVEVEVTDPTLGNGDGTYDVTVSSIYVIEENDDIVGVEWSGSQKVTVDSFTGNTVTLLFESPDGVDSYATEGDGQLNGTLTVRARN